MLLIPFQENLVGMGIAVVGCTVVEDIDLDYVNSVFVEDIPTITGILRVDLEAEPTPTEITNITNSAQSWDFRDRVDRSLSEVVADVQALSEGDFLELTQVAAAIVLISLPGLCEALGYPFVTYTYVDP